MSTPRSSVPAHQALSADAEIGLEPNGVGFLLGVAHRAHRKTWEAALADLDLTAPQAALLRLIAARPGQGIRQLARRLGTDPMNVQRVAESLLGAGLCEARHDPHDARRRPLYPTRQGIRRARAVARRAEAAEDALVQALGSKPYAALLAGLHACIALDRHASDRANGPSNSPSNDPTDGPTTPGTASRKTP